MKDQSRMELQTCKEYGAELIFTYAEDSLKSRTEKLLSHFNSNFLFKYNAQSKDDGLILKDSIQSNVGELDGIVHSIAFAPRESLKVTLLILTVSRGLPLHIKLAVTVLEIWPKTYHHC